MTLTRAAGDVPNGYPCARPGGRALLVYPHHGRGTMDNSGARPPGSPVLTAVDSWAERRAVPVILQ